MTDGVRIVILPGWGQHSEHWQEFLRAVGPRGSVIDLPGFGKEPLVSAEWGVPEYAEWVKRKIEQKGDLRVILLGHSFGGRIASFIASEQPPWLVGLILYGAPSIYRPSLWVNVRMHIAQRLRPFKKMLKQFMHHDARDADAHGMGDIFRKTVPFDQTSLLPRVAVPTLLVWGEKDVEVPVRIAKEMNQLIPGNRLVILARLGHNAHLENPTLFYGTVEKFIRTSR